MYTLQRHENSTIVSWRYRIAASVLPSSARCVSYILPCGEFSMPEIQHPCLVEFKQSI
jgi:hypothetical protein